MFPPKHLNMFYVCFRIKVLQICNDEWRHLPSACPEEELQMMVSHVCSFVVTTFFQVPHELCLDDWQNMNFPSGSWNAGNSFWNVLPAPAIAHKFNKQSSRRLLKFTTTSNFHSDGWNTDNNLWHFLPTAALAHKFNKESSRHLLRLTTTSNYSFRWLKYWQRTLKFPSGRCHSCIAHKFNKWSSRDLLKLTTTSNFPSDGWNANNKLWNWRRSPPKRSRHWDK